MPRIVTSAVLDAPAEEVWELLRDFSAIGSWHPHLPAAESVTKQVIERRYACSHLLNDAGQYAYYGRVGAA